MNKLGDLSDLTELLAMMARFRDPTGGSSWDLQQNFASLVPHTLEETYELIEAIEAQDKPAILSELGDMLYQIIYYAQLAKEKGWFEFQDVLAHLKDKLQKRHGQDLKGSRDGNQQWEQVKAEERAQKYGDALLADIPQTLPALIRAQKMQKRAADYGFDWPDVASVIEKVKEEVAELEDAYERKDMRHTTEELGDVMFVCTSLARHLKTDAETLMRAANRKFQGRFEGVAEKVKTSGKAWDALTLAELDAYWDAVKIDEKERISS